MKRTLLALTLAGLAVLATPGSAMAVSGNETFRTITFGNNPMTNQRIVIATGVINAAGTEQVQPGPQGIVHANWNFPAGSLAVTMNLNINFQGDPVAPACISNASITGTYTITSGTGAYSAASGSGTIAGTGRVFSVYDPVSGTCSEMAANLFLNQRTFRGTISV